MLSRGRGFLAAFGFAAATGATAMLTLLERKHIRKPHYYIPAIGVRPEFQGRGLGTALLRPTLERCDSEGLPAYLEASSGGQRAAVPAPRLPRPRGVPVHREPADLADGARTRLGAAPKLAAAKPLDLDAPLAGHPPQLGRRARAGQVARLGNLRRRHRRRSAAARRGTSGAADVGISVPRAENHFAKLRKQLQRSSSKAGGVTPFALLEIGGKRLERPRATPDRS